MAASKPTTRPTPPLESGDCLTRAEFERRYEAMPALKKAELIDGVVYTQPRVPYQTHGRQHALLDGWLGCYTTYTPPVDGGSNSTVRLDLDNVPQPDLLLRLPESAGGQSRVDADGYIDGPPELVAEIVASSAAYDLHQKLNVYRRHGVREYLVWRVLDEAIDWLILREDRFDPLSPDPGGIYKSEAFPGLWLDAAALLRGDQAEVLNVLNQGLASAEHAAFVERLKIAADNARDETSDD
ncbi:MAG TPA: Uma2 family endonuclease [Thermoguttaceae bacterium]|nr:Uma2 family endonuclease [Thermoguttaceae bacterium]